MPIAAKYVGSRRFDVIEKPPVRPGPGQVRLSVAFAGICGTDRHIYHGNMDARVKPPHVCGHEMAGTIAEIGPNVTGWRVGEPAVVRPIAPCRSCPACKAGHSHICQRLNFLGVDSPGAFQGSWTVPAHTLHRLPPGIDMRDAAFVEPLAVACHDLRLGGVRAGQYVCVIGGGPIGMLIAMAGRHMGAKCLLLEINPKRAAIAHEMALTTADPTAQDVVALVEQQTAGAGADVVFEVSAAEPAAALMTRLARVRGTIVQVGIFHKPALVDLNRVFLREQILRGARVYEPEDYEMSISLLPHLPVRKLLSAEYPLSRIGDAFADLERRSELMKVLLDCTK